jgi:TonB family protein
MTRSLFYSLLVFSASLVVLPATAQRVAVGELLAANDSLAARAGTSAPKAGAVAKPARLRRALASPVYPVRAAQFGVEGEVRVAYTVNVKGRAREVVILAGQNQGFDEEVYRVLRQARFHPARDASGQPVPSRYMTTFHFSLDN